MRTVLLTNDSRYHGEITIRCAPLRECIYVEQRHNGQHHEISFRLSQVKSVSEHTIANTCLGTKIEIKGRKAPVLLKGISTNAIETTLAQAHELHRKTMTTLNPLLILDEIGKSTWELLSLAAQAAKAIGYHASGAHRRQAQENRNNLEKRFGYNHLDL